MTRFARRTFLRSASLTFAAAAARPLWSFNGTQLPPPGRPPLLQRRFVSKAVEDAIQSISAQIAEDDLRTLFSNCLPNTLDTTVFVGEADGKPDTYVITGDIDAMWLRDSSAQVWPYLQFARQDEDLRRLLEGVVRRHARCICIDPYANAFRRDPHDPALEYAQKDATMLVPGVAERKWEIDSLCYPMRLAYGYWRATGDTAPFDAGWRAAANRVLETFREQQRLDGPGPYHFQRQTRIPTDTLMLSGFGNPARPNGLIYSMFRPSDDACIFPQFVPANLFAAVCLDHMAEIANAVHDDSLASRSAGLASVVRSALQQHGRAQHPVHGEIWAYEVDGYGNYLLMDDANSPGLVCLPYLGAASATEPLYSRTRAFALSRENPYYFSGTVAQGIGSPHTGLKRIWPIALTMQALTSTSDREIIECLRGLCRAARATGFMHESFHQDNAASFTRSWFAWANTLFGELIVYLAQNKPALLRERML